VQSGHVTERMLDPQEGDIISFNAKGKPADGKVTKRTDNRLRVEQKEGSCWIEPRDVVSILSSNPAPVSAPGTTTSSTAASLQPPAATPTATMAPAADVPAAIVPTAGAWHMASYDPDVLREAWSDLPAHIQAEIRAGFGFPNPGPPPGPPPPHAQRFDPSIAGPKAAAPPVKPSCAPPPPPAPQAASLGASDTAQREATEREYMNQLQAVVVDGKVRPMCRSIIRTLA
jgi:hypothetical protein